MIYIHHTKNVIDVSPRNLPRAHGNTSGLEHASVAELKALGWLPAVVSDPAFDPDTQVRSGPVGGQVGDAVPSNATDVSVEFTVRDKTAQEIDDDIEHRAGGILSDRSMGVFIMALNKGLFVPGSNYNKAQMRAIVKATIKAES